MRGAPDYSVGPVLSLEPWLSKLSKLSEAVEGLSRTVEDCRKHCRTTVLSKLSKALSDTVECCRKIFDSEHVPLLSKHCRSCRDCRPLSITVDCRMRLDSPALTQPRIRCSQADRCTPPRHQYKPDTLSLRLHSHEAQAGTPSRASFHHPRRPYLKGCVEAGVGSRSP